MGKTKIYLEIYPFLRLNFIAIKNYRVLLKKIPCLLYKIVTSKSDTARDPELAANDGIAFNIVLQRERKT